MITKAALLLFLVGHLTAADEHAASNLRRAAMAGPIDFDFAMSDPLPKIGSFLSDLWKQSAEGVAAGQSIGFFTHDYDSLSGLLSVSNDLVPVDIVAPEAGSDMEKLLVDAGSLGFKVSEVCGGMASGSIPVKALQDLSGLDSLVIANPVLTMVEGTPKAEFHSDVADFVSPFGESPTQPGFGSVLSEGIFPLNAKRIVMDGLRNVDGHAITVGVISDSYDKLKDTDDTAVTAEDDIESEDLPPEHKILVLKDDDMSGRDQGRAMMQVVHDLAPQARMAFYTGTMGQCDAANGIKLLAAGSNIIVDNVVYLNEPFFQDGKIAQAVDYAYHKGVTYFSSAGNFNRDSYEGPFINSGLQGPRGGFLHDFDPSDAVDVQQDVRLEPGAAVVINWDQPYASVEGSVGSASDVNAYLISNRRIVAFGSVNSIGGDPIEILMPNISQETVAQLLIEFVRGPPPQLVKAVVIGGEFLEHQTFSSTSFGHANSFGGAGVGANFWRETPYFGFPDYTIQPYSSVGGVPILFDGAGHALKTPIVRQQPLVVGPDGVSNTFFGEDIIPFPFPLFFGTAAAAAHVAGVAALILDKAADKGKKLYPEDVFAILSSTARDMDDPFTPEFDVGFDFGTGFGFVNAWKALDKVGGYKPIGRDAVHEPKQAADKVAGKKGKGGD